MASCMRGAALTDFSLAMLSAVWKGRTATNNALRYAQRTAHSFSITGGKISALWKYFKRQAESWHSNTVVHLLHLRVLSS